MKEILHFKSQKERLDYLKGGFEEIKPIEVIIPKEEKIVSAEATDAVEAKPKKSSRKKGKKDDKVQAE